MNNILTSVTKPIVQYALGLFLVLGIVALAPIKVHAFDLMDAVDPFGIFEDGDSSDNVPKLAVSCNANKTSAKTGENVIWVVSVSGGTGKYNYKWTGSETLQGSERTLTKSYIVPGYKDATVTVKSAGRTKKVACGTTVLVSSTSNTNNDNDDDDNDNDSSLRVSCYPDDRRIEEGDSVTWRSSVSGGNGNYDYEWDGDENLNGDDDRVTKRYNDEGRMEATLTVRASNGDRKTVDCDDLIVGDEDNYDDDYDDDYDDYDDDYDNDYGSLGAVCYADASVIGLNQRVTWRVSSAWGGNGNYSYEWRGTEGLSGRTSSLTHAYRTNGTKYASVIIKSGGRSKTVECQNSVLVEGGQFNTIIGGGALSLSCAPNVTSARVGNRIVWSSNVAGGNGIYTYTWTGTDGVTSSASTMSALYDGAGTKYAYLTVRSGSDTATKACGTVSMTYAPAVSAAARPAASTSNLQAVCYPNTDEARVGESVLWTVEANGGTGSYTYDWMGAENLKGTQPISVISYDDKGAKFAVVTVKSGSQSVTQACESMVTVGGGSVFGASAFFGLGGISWGFIGFLVVLLLILMISYILYNKNKI